MHQTEKCGHCGCIFVGLALREEIKIDDDIEQDVHAHHYAKRKEVINNKMLDDIAVNNFHNCRIAALLPQKALVNQNINCQNN